MTEIGSRIRTALTDRYTLERELGRGGMAVVFLAHDRKLDRPIALKVLLPELAVTLGAERFLREIEIVAKLTHPNILSLYDCGEADGLLYYVMPYVAGESLRDRLDREKQLPIEDALQITREVADALGYAHDHEVIHRDIKPENILLEAGHAVVTDFGIAKAVTEAGGENLTATGLAVGTPAYMSPEQALAASEIDARSDVYSLGCVLYEMLGGEPPYTGPTPQSVFAKRLSEPVPHVSTLRETIPRNIEHAITRALAKAPADRFVTTAAFVEALTTPVTLYAERAAAGHRRIPRRWAVIGLAGVIAVGAVAVVLVRGLLSRASDPAADLSRVAVLPCANRMGDPEQDYIAAGVHDEIITGLGRIAAVEVRGRSSVMRYRDTAISPPEIARELGVGGLVECSVFPVNTDSVRVTASLRHAPRDRQVWSHPYQRAAANVFLLGNDVARGVAEALDANVTATERTRIAAQPTENQEALTHYHRGRYLIDRWSEEGNRRGIEHFEQAIALDSTFALAYAGLAEAIMMQGDVVGASGDIRPVDYMPRVRELVLQALDLDSVLADAYRVLGWIRWSYDYDYAAAEREARRATELDPTNAAAWSNYGSALSVMDRDEDAIVAGRRAIELDPVAPWILSDFSATLLLADKYHEALDTANAAMQLDPSLATAYWNAGDATFLLGNHGEAIGLHEQARARSDHPIYLGNLGGTYARVGNTEAALNILEQLLQMRSRRYVAPRAFAHLYLGLDSLDTAMEWLVRGAETRDPWLHWHIRNPLDRDKLRAHPRYPELLRLLRLER